MWGEALGNTREMLCDVKHCDENCGGIGQSQENLGGGVLCNIGKSLRDIKKTQENNER